MRSGHVCCVGKVRNERMHCRHKAGNEVTATGNEATATAGSRMKRHAQLSLGHCSEESPHSQRGRLSGLLLLGGHGEDGLQSSWG